MKTNMKRLTHAAMVVITAGFALSSCGPAKLKPGPLVSKPPAKALKANQEFSVGDGIIIKKFIYPSGLYQPVHEDPKAFYYAPPGEQIKVSDTGMSYGSQGGIYWEKGMESPQKVYFTGNFGIKLPWDKKDLPVTIVR